MLASFDDCALYTDLGFFLKVKSKINQEYYLLIAQKGSLQVRQRASVAFFCLRLALNQDLFNISINEDVNP